MHLYWRVIEELRYLGEGVQIHDPCLSREYRRWLFERSAAIAMLSEFHPSLIPKGLDTITRVSGPN